MSILRDRCEEWLSQHPHATLRDAIYAGALIELNLWCNKEK